MWKNVPWTKTMLEDFIEEALLTEEEEKILRTRIAGWSIVKQALEFEMSTATVSRYVNNIKKKYDKVHNLYPDRFKLRKESIYEQSLDNTDPTKEQFVQDLFRKLGVDCGCGRDPYTMTIAELIECQKNCTFNNGKDDSDDDNSYED